MLFHISKVFSSIVEKDKNNIIYIVNREGNHDSLGFVVNRNNLKKIDKKSKKIIARYKHDHNFVKAFEIITIINKTKIDLDYRGCDQDVTISPLFYLLKN